ncbi:MAG TPA: YrbL family protein [Hyphomicrobiaceae bacterium]|nr:YrbL family protein [Hyphomicrobiaceae bacterium]
MLLLKEAEVVAAGSTRNVYRHPDNPSLLIKVIRPAAIEERFGSGAPWYKFRRRRYRHLIAYLREIREQIAVHAMGGAYPPYLQKIVGIVETDLGMGFVVEAVFGRDGNFAPTVADLIRRGQLDRTIRAKLDHFLEELVASPVIVADLNPSNVVLGFTPEHGEHFVLIDGIGFKNIIPLERMSAYANRWGKARKASQFRAAVEARAARVGAVRGASEAPA